MVAKVKRGTNDRKEFANFFPTVSSLSDEGNYVI